MDKYKTKKNYISRKNKNQYNNLMSINEVSPSNYSAIGSLYPKTAASEYQPSKGVSRTESQDNFISGRNRKFNNNVFRSHNTNNIRDEEKRNRSLGIMSVDNALIFLH